MNMRFVFISAAVAVSVLTFGAFQRLVSRSNVNAISLPPELAALVTFTDAPSFEKVSPQVFRYVDETREPYLRLSFPSGKYENLRMLLRLRASDANLKGMFPRGASGRPTLVRPMEVRDGIATFEFAHVSEPATVYHTGRTYIGVSFSPNTIGKNDVVEVVELKFFYAP